MIIATGIASHNILPIITASPPVSALAILLLYHRLKLLHNTMIWYYNQVLKGVCEDAIGSHKAFKAIRSAFSTARALTLSCTDGFFYICNFF